MYNSSVCINCVALLMKCTTDAVLQEMKRCAAVINMLHLIPAASQKMIEPLVTITLNGEKALLVEVGNTFNFLPKCLQWLNYYMVSIHCSIRCIMQ